MNRRIAAGLAVAGAALLVAAEFSAVYEVVVGTLQIPRRTVSGGDNHSYALVLVAAAALGMAFGALRGARAAAVALVALGATALVVGLALDLPDARATGQLPESVTFEDAKAKPCAGLFLELAGGGLLVLAGVAALAPAARGIAPGRSRRKMAP
jgi:hypothetical protein